MSTPKGKKCVPRTLMTGDKVFVYSNADQIILQVRHEVPSEESLLEPSVKVGIVLSAAEAITIASDLLNAALPQFATLQATTDLKAEQGGS